MVGVPSARVLFRFSGRHTDCSCYLEIAEVIFRSSFSKERALHASDSRTEGADQCWKFTDW